MTDYYQPLFDHMQKVHGLTLLQSEMDEIILLVQETIENRNEALRVVCDVEGCSETSTAGGTCWREAGYLCVCSYHSQMFLHRKPMPKLKQSAIDREKTRKPDGTLP